MRIVAFIQARAGGTRFPGKVFAPFTGGTVIRAVLTNARLCVGRSVWVLVPAGQKEEREFALLDNVIEGPEEDVRGRFLLAAESLGLDDGDIVVRFTADDPYKCPELVRYAVNSVRDGDTCYCDTNHGNVTGLGCQAFTVAYLKRSTETEHVVPAKFDHVSLTVDTPADLERVQRLTRPL